MRNIISPNYVFYAGVIWLLFLLTMIMPWTASAATVDIRYPGLATGLLKSAVLTPLDKDTLLAADGFSITHSQMLENIQDQEPKLREQLKKNLFFLLEQEAVRQVLLSEVQKAGISVKEGDDSRAIQALFAHRTRDLAVSEEEARAFYAANKEMVGSTPFEQVADGIRQYLLKDKQQQAVSAYIDSLGEVTQLRINDKWVEAQNRLAMDNPVDKARRSDKPTMVEFGAAGCVPCDMMQPILDKLRKTYPDKLNVVFVHVREEQILAARYGIRSIPVQVFYDASGTEVFRHVGFFAQTEVDKQLAAMGVKQ
ncbi:MAG: thioredoxin family protein [Desulfobacteraceae bacterium]|nr:thioredoxin family protein [Desulfobacteraceae bacterium]